MQTKDLTDAIRRTFVSEIYDRIYDEYLEQHNRFEKKHWNTYYEKLEKDPICYTLLSLSKTNTSSTMVPKIMEFVETYATELVNQEIGYYPKHPSYDQIEKELNLFSTTIDFEECEDAYEVIDILVEYFIKELTDE